MNRAVLLLAALTLVSTSLLISPRGHALPSSPCVCSVDAPVHGGDWVRSGYPGQSCEQVLINAEVYLGNLANNTCDQQGLALCSITDETQNYYCECFSGGQCQVQFSYSFQCTVCNSGNDN